MKYEVTLTLELEIDAPTREHAEAMVHNIKRFAAFDHPCIKLKWSHAGWEIDDDGN